MATAGVFDIELNEDGADDSDHSDEEPIKPASEQHVQVMIVVWHSNNCFLETFGCLKYIHLVQLSTACQV